MSSHSQNMETGRVKQSLYVTKFNTYGIFTKKLTDNLIHYIWQQQQRDNEKTEINMGACVDVMRLWFARDILRYRNVFWLIDWLIDCFCKFSRLVCSSMIKSASCCTEELGSWKLKFLSYAFNLQQKCHSGNFTEQQSIAQQSSRKKIQYV